MRLRKLSRELDLKPLLRVSVPLLGTLAIAAFIRFSELEALPIDRLWETYSRWLLNVLTIRDSWTYAPQLAPRAAMGWLPLFQYLSMAAMAFSSNYRIEPLRLTNVFLALITIVAVYFSVWKVFNSQWQAIVSALVLAVQPWHIDYSTTASDRILLGLLIVALTYAMFAGKVKLFAGLAILTMFTAYEGWFIVPLEMALGFAMGRWTPKQLTLFGIISVSTVCTWMTWNAVALGSPFYFISDYLESSGYVFGLDAGGLTFYLVLATAMTSGLFLIGLTATLLRKTSSPRSILRALAIVIVGYIGLYSIVHYIGFEVGDLTGRIVPILPLVAVTVSFVFPTFPAKRRKQLLVGALLLAMLVISYYAQISIGPRKVYVILPEQRVGDRLRTVYKSGRVICDLPAVIYYSGLDPSIFVSSSSISGDTGNLSASSLEELFNVNQIRFVVWENVTASRLPKILPMLGESVDYRPSSYVLGSVQFTLVYEDSFATGRWEHDPSFAGPPAIFIFQVDLPS
jgi:hypothetical protein